MGFDTINEAVAEWGTNDFFGIWLLPNGRYLSCPPDDDHRCASNDMLSWLLEGCLSLRIGHTGALNIRAIQGKFYGARVRQELDKQVRGRSRVYLTYFDEEGHVVDNQVLDNPGIEIAQITDPYMYSIWKSEEEYV